MRAPIRLLAALANHLECGCFSFPDDIPREIDSRGYDGKKRQRSLLDGDRPMHCVAWNKDEVARSNVPHLVANTKRRFAFENDEKLLVIRLPVHRGDVIAVPEHPGHDALADGEGLDRHCCGVRGGDRRQGLGGCVKVAHRGLLQ